MNSQSSHPHSVSDVGARAPKTALWRTRLLWACVSLPLVACGGGGGGDDTTAAAPPPPAPAPGPAAPAPSPAAPAPGPAPAPTPPLSTTTTPLDGTQLGVHVSTWPDNGNTADTSTGGQGNPVGDESCQTSEAFHIHAHLSIFQNGQQLALPSHVGTVASPACTYDTHTHDRSGVIHVESGAAPPTPFTLGDFFAVWGQPLTATNIAGLSDPSIVAYVNDDGTLTQWTGNLADILLLAHREITIVLGTAPSEIPTYEFTAFNP